MFISESCSGFIMCSLFASCIFIWTNKDDDDDDDEWDGRCDWLQTTAEHDIIWSMWAGDHGELFFCIHLNRVWQFRAKSNELTDAFFWLVLLTAWAQGFSLLRDKRGLTLPGSGTIIVPVLWLLFSRLSMLQSFQPLSGNSLNSLRAPYCFDRYRFLIRITSSCEISWFCLIFADI